MVAHDTNITPPAKTLTDLKQALSPELSNVGSWLKTSVVKNINAGLAPEYLQRLFSPCYSDYNKKTLGQRPRPNYSKRSFSYGGAKFWNDFLNSLKDVSSIVQYEEGIHHIGFPLGNHVKQLLTDRAPVAQLVEHRAVTREVVLKAS